jgi:hypothetical protein
VGRTDTSQRTDHVVRLDPEAIGESIENRRSEAAKKQGWTTVVMVATYRYLSEGVRMLGEAYSMHNDRDTE